MKMNKKRRSYKFHQWIKIFICLVSIGCHYEPIQAQEQEQEQEQGPLENLIDETPDNGIKTVKQACSKLNHQIIINVDLMYFLKNCTLHFIPDPEIANLIIHEQNKKTHYIDNKIYAAIPTGSDYTMDSYFHDYPPARNRTLAETCKAYNGHIISIDDYNFYYIENCKKRRFESYSSLQVFNSVNNSIDSISEYEFNQFPEGKVIKLQLKPKDIKEISETNIKKNLPNTNILCRNVDKKIVSFHDSFYYVEKCILRPITNFSIDIQVAAQERGGLIELNVEQALGLEEGEEISRKDVLKKLNAL